MAEYYYLVATLTYLKFADAPPVSSEEFLSECRRWLSPEDMRSLESAGRGHHELMPGDAPVLKEWKAFDRRLREELAVVRSARKKSEAFKAPERLRQFVDQQNPLLVELELERFRWGFLEDRGAVYFFDVNALIVYFLKLQMLERMAEFNKDAGEKFFYKYCEVDYEKEVRQHNGD